MSIRRHFPFAAAAISALLLNVSTSVAWSADIEWKQDLRAASQESGQTGRPLLLKFTADWCGYCRKMKAETFSDPRIVEHVTGCFVPVEVNADRNPKLMEAIGVEALPTTVIVSPELRVIRKFKGYQSADQLDGYLNQICQVAHRRESHAPLAVSQAVASNPAPAGDEAQPQSAAEPPREAAADDYSFAGCCLVSLIDRQTLAQGDPQFSVSWRHRKVCFVGRPEMEAFLASPDRYWPQLDGACMVTAIDGNELIDGHPGLGVIYRGRIWYFRGEEELSRFEQRPEYYIHRVPERHSR